MRIETLLAGGIAALVVTSLVTVALVPGVVADRPDDVRRGHLRVNEVTISSGEVTADTATLQVRTHLGHRGGTSENVSVEVRAVDLDSGMVTTTRRVDLDPVSGDTEVAVPVNLSVERDGGYRIESIVYVDGRREETARTEVRGVGTLKPPQQQSSIRFHRFDDIAGEGSLPSVQYGIESVSGNQTTMDVSAYLTNQGSDGAGDLRVEFVVRQAESNIVADRATVPVGEIRPGRTATPNATVTVPSGYNYYIDAILWKDGVVVGTARSAANLDPKRTISVNESVEDVGLKVGDFDKQREEAPEREGTPTGMPEAANSAPGLGFGAALLALVGAGLIARRNS